MDTAVRLVVSGRVQMVAFRHYTVEEARRIGLAGWVRNVPDGTVEAFAQGSKEQVELLIHWCKTGSPMARVDRVDVEWTEPSKAIEEFSVRY